MGSVSKINGKKVIGEKVFTDNKGFRVKKNHEAKDKSNLKEIYFIGGSTTFGNGVLQKNTFSGILKNKPPIFLISCS